MDVFSIFYFRAREYKLSYVSSISVTVYGPIDINDLQTFTMGNKVNIETSLSVTWSFSELWVEILARSYNSQSPQLTSPKQWLYNQYILLLNCPALKPTETIWDFLARKICQDLKQYDSHEDLQISFAKTWYSLPKLIDSTNLKLTETREIQFLRNPMY